jgi:hypothetical protein
MSSLAATSRSPLVTATRSAMHMLVLKAYSKVRRVENHRWTQSGRHSRT